MKYLVLDFESRSVISLKHASYHRYASHPMTDLLCIGLKWDDRPARVHSPHNSTVLDGTLGCIEIQEAIRIGCPIVVHNVAFEKRMYYWICHKRFGWPAVPDTQWVDTMASCAYYTIPQGLAKAAKALNLKHRKDEDAGRELDTDKKKGDHVLTQVMKPRTPGKQAVEDWLATGKPIEQMPPIWWEDTVRLNKLYEYCRADVETQAELFEALGPLPAGRWHDWQLDQKINDRGVPVDWCGLLEVNTIVEKSLEGFNEEVRKLTASGAYPHGMVQTVSEVANIKTWCELKGYKLSSLSKEYLEEILVHADIPDPVRQLLSLRQAAGKTSLGKITSMLNLSDTDMRLRDSLAWHGAATGRWAGRGWQPHNLPRECMSDAEAQEFHEALQADPYAYFRKRQGESIPGIISSSLRSFIMAGPGKRLLISDFASIEARVLAWFAGCNTMLDAFKAGKCVYTQFASKATGKREADIAKKSRDRQLGKAAVLGLGYGMGAGKFKDTASAQYNVEMTDAEAETIKTLYRTVYREVPTFWKAIENAFREAIKTKGQMTCGRFMIGCNGPWAYIVLPSGRAIWYREPKLIRVPNPWRDGTIEQISYMSTDMQKRWVRQTTFGGKITENICQAIAADILTEAVRRTENAGYNIILSVHDEVIAESDKDEAEFHRLMKISPAWAADLPLDCETHSSVRYGK